MDTFNHGISPVSQRIFQAQIAALLGVAFFRKNGEPISPFDVGRLNDKDILTVMRREDGAT